jgi:hypothetical protein
MISEAPAGETATRRGSPSPPRRASAGRFGAYTEEEYKDHRVSAHESRRTRAAFTWPVAGPEETSRGLA